MKTIKLLSIIGTLLSGIQILILYMILIISDLSLDNYTIEILSQFAVIDGILFIVFTTIMMITIFKRDEDFDFIKTKVT